MVVVELADPSNPFHGRFVSDVAPESVARVGRVDDHTALANDGGSLFD